MGETTSTESKRRNNAGLAHIAGRLYRMLKTMPEGPRKVAVTAALAAIVTAILEGCGVHVPIVHDVLNQE